MTKYLFQKIKHLFFPSEPRAFTIDQLADMDVAVYEDSQNEFGEERLQIEDGQVVGMSATLEDHRLSMTVGRLPKKYNSCVYQS